MGIPPVTEPDNEMTFQKGFDPTIKRLVHEAQHGFCKLCQNQLMDFHHRMPNTKVNNLLCPRFIPSIFNCAGLCRNCHTNRIHELKITEGEALAYEEWLEENMK